MASENAERLCMPGDDGALTPELCPAAPAMPPDDPRHGPMANLDSACVPACQITASPRAKLAMRSPSGKGREVASADSA